MKDTKFTEIWAKVTTVWKHRKTSTKDEWEALTANMKMIGKHVKADPFTVRELDGSFRQIDITRGKTPGRRRRAK